MSFRVSRTLIFCILAVSSLLLVYGPQPVAAATIGIPVTVKGLSPQLSTTVVIDGKEQGTIAGGSTETFNVDKNTAHTFEVEAQIKGMCTTYEDTDVCTRFSNTDNIWTLDIISTENCQDVPVCHDAYYYCDYYGYCWWEPYCTYEKQCWATTQLAEKEHTFAYSVEHEVVISDVHGQHMDTWQAVDSNVSLSANEFAVTIDESSVKERDVFVHWVVNGAPIEGRTLTLKADKPLYVKAEYRTETRYRIRLSSDFGNPTLDSPDGWYVKSQQATVSVEEEVPLEGFWGALGGRAIFVAWHSPQGVESRDPTYTFTVQDPKSLVAEWVVDNSQPMTIIAVAAGAIVMLLVVLTLHRTGHLLRRKGKGEPTELEKAKAK